MPKNYQIIPERQFPHQHVEINDNTQYLNPPASDAGDTSMLFVFASPKGRSGMQTIRDGEAGFVKEYGNGPFSLYGQPFLNALSSARSGAATLHCLRVTAPDASYSAAHLVAKYKVEGEELNIRFEVLAPEAAITDLGLLDEAITVPVEEDETGVHLMSFAYLGKGSHGNNIRPRITTDAASDKENIYKNYIVEIYENEGTVLRRETFPVAFNEDALIAGVSKFSDAIINDPESGSSLVKMVTHVDGISKIYEAYKDANPTTILTLNDFDVFLGIDKYAKSAIKNYKIDTVSEGSISVNRLGGFALMGGSDGQFGANIDPEVRSAALDGEYVKAFSGETDPYIKSKNKYPTNIILDANYSIPVKQLIASLATARGDCVAILDAGTGITSKSAVLPFVSQNLDSYVTNRVHSLDAYCGKIRDPYSGKIVTVTSTYFLASRYPVHFQNEEAKHVPLAGNTRGIISGFIPNSIYPVFDEDIDGDLMDELTEANVNFARLNVNQDVIRAIQETRQQINSGLSELSNVFILLDIKRDCEKLCARIDFNFSEPEDIARFNNMARDLLGSYSESQVRSIEAVYDKSDWEAERGIIHLYVSLVNKDITKTSIIEIDVNRDF